MGSRALVKTGEGRARNLISKEALNRYMGQIEGKVGRVASNFDGSTSFFINAQALFIHKIHPICAHCMRYCLSPSIILLLLPLAFPSS